MATAIVSHKEIHWQLPSRDPSHVPSMIFSFADLIAYITTFMTIKPGDVIATGTPTKRTPRGGAPRWLKPGDVIEISVAEIGTLRNTVVDEA